MLAETTETEPAAGHKHHLAFFRQSGWMMVAATAGGLLMYAVHMVAQRMPKEEYGVFTTLLQVVALIGIPAVGLQGVFAQQAAASMHAEHERELAGVFRGVLRGTFFIWLAGGRRWSSCSADQILAALKIYNPAALWVTVVIGLVALWRPMVMGVLQGRQNFLWFGWSDHPRRRRPVRRPCACIVGLARWLRGGRNDRGADRHRCVVMIIGGWFSRDCLAAAKAAPMDWAAWLRRVVPLTLGLGVRHVHVERGHDFRAEVFSEGADGLLRARRE